MDFYKGTIPIIDTDTTEGLNYAMPQRDINGDKIGYGYVPRDYTKYPEEMFDPPTGLKIYNESEWDAIYDEQEELQSSSEHIYLSGPGGSPRFVNLDQNGHGYCWSYSTHTAMMLDMLQSNTLTVRLNPHAVAAIIKNGRDEGGWWGLSAKFCREHGAAVEGTGPGQWPLHSRSLSKDTPELRKEMKRFVIQEEWVDLTRDVYSQNMSRAAFATCGLINVPCPSDFNWWGHSVCQVRWVRIERGSWGPLILNSWKGWGRFGLAVLRGSQAGANGGGAVRGVWAARAA